MEGKLTGVLSNCEIVEGYHCGDIVISPFEEGKVNNTSYDVTIGPYYYEPSFEGIDFFDISSNECIRKVFGTVREAEIYTGQFPHSKLKPGDRFIRLKKDKTYLCHTNEFIGGRTGITTMMKAKSSTGRCGISVCQCAGWGDVGYFNRWTMEVRNQNEVDVILRVGDPIAQIVFFYTNADAFQYSERGNYQSSVELGDVMAKWNPEMMLPIKK